MYFKTKIFGVLSALLLFGGVTFAATPQVTVPDSIAGEDIDVRVSGLFSQESVDLQVVRPQQNSVMMTAQADEFGILRSTLHNLHFHTAGDYSLNVFRDMETVSQDFHVFAGSVSAYRSEIAFRDKSIEADGEAEARFSVTLRDAFGNPVVGESVKVFSTRNEDAVIAGGTSDEYGYVNGKISSRTPGISTISVLVGEMLLFEKPEVVFFLSGSLLGNVGSGVGDFIENFESYGMGEALQTSLFPEGDEDVAYFSLENIKTDVVIGQNITAKVVARDKEGEVVPTYRGTVRFSSSDDRADLPADYRFIAEDQGSHTFFLAFTFQTPGNQSLAVHALEDLRRAGEIELKVTLGGGSITIPQGEESISLITPRPGTYRSERVTITGEAQKIDAITITDGPTLLVEGLKVDVRGNFLYQTPRLGDGMHIFKAASTANDQLVSNEIIIRVDQSPPQNISVMIAPEGYLEKGQPFTVTITADEPLSGANSIFQGILTAHEMQGDAFVATLTAPKESGEYPLDVNAADILGNQIDFPNADIIIVGGEENAIAYSNISVDITPTGRLKKGQPFTVTITATEPLSSADSVFQGYLTAYHREGDAFVATLNAPQTAGRFPLDVKAINLSGNQTDFPRVAIIIVGDDLVAPTTATNVSAESGDGKVTLFWSPAKDDSGIANYRVEFGDAETGEGDFNIVPDNRTQWYIDGLSDDKEYFFQVIAIDEMGNESPISEKVFAMTAGSTMHSVAPEPDELEKSGGTAPFWPIIIAVLAGGGILLLSKRRQA